MGYVIYKPRISPLRIYRARYWNNVKMAIFHWKLWKYICLRLFPISFQQHSNYNFNSSLKKIFWQHRKASLMLKLAFSSLFLSHCCFSSPCIFIFFQYWLKSPFLEWEMSKMSPEAGNRCSPLPGGNRHSLVLLSFATILFQPWKAANGGYCFFAGYGFVLDPCAKCKHVISPHLLYPKTFPMSIFNFQVHLCTDWNPPNMLLRKCKPTHCWFGIKCSYASTLPFQSLPQSCSMCPFNTFFSPLTKRSLCSLQEPGAVFSILFLFIPWSLLLFSQLIYPLFTAHMFF